MQNTLPEEFNDQWCVDKRYAYDGHEVVEDMSSKKELPESAACCYRMQWTWYVLTIIAGLERPKR